MSDTAPVADLAPDNLVVWKGVLYDKRCLDARYHGGHRDTCDKCSAKGCCGHCLADGFVPLAELDARARASQPADTEEQP